MDPLYSSWNAKCGLIAAGSVQSWKRDADVVGMLQHVRPHEASVYLNLLLTKLPLYLIQEYCNSADSVGDPARYEFDTGFGLLRSSPTALRYLFHAYDIIKMVKGETIVEIGGGYGGLVVAIDFLAKLTKQTLNYIIVDLTNVQRLQRYNTAQYTLSLNLTFVDAQHYGSDIETPNLFVVSNYCLAEMGSVNRENYITNLFSKPSIQGGYMQWNSQAPVNFLSRFVVRVKAEYPMTNPRNTTIQFHR